MVERALADQTLDIVKQQELRFQQTQNSHDHPDAYLYTSAMDVLAKVGTIDSAQSAEQLWQRLKNVKRHSEKTIQNVKPTIYTYTALITAWSRVTMLVPEASQRVSELLDELWEDNSVRLNHRPFAAALRGFARSHYPVTEEPNKALLALKLVKRLREAAKQNVTLKPNAAIYSAAIDCCGRVLTSQPLEEQLCHDRDSTILCQTSALKIAFAVFQAMKSDQVRPDSSTYKSLMLCTSSLLPPGKERTKVLDSIFLQAKEARVANEMVIRTLRVQRNGDFAYWQAFVLEHGLGNDRGHVDWQKIPNSWYKNTRYLFPLPSTLT